MSQLETDFLAVWRSYPGLVEPEREHQFAKSIGRNWSFDFCWSAFKVAVEIEGSGGRHHSFIGFHKDCDKYNSAIKLGWRVLRFTTKHITDDPDDMVQLILEAIGSSPHSGGGGA